MPINPFIPARLLEGDISHWQDDVATTYKGILSNLIARVQFPQEPDSEEEDQENLAV